ncbi:MAG: DUF4260 family protein, partial [Gammaproteobacteria bacterium]
MAAIPKLALLGVGLIGGSLAAALRQAAARLGVAPEAVLMVGDMPVDMLVARRAGAQALGVAGGDGSVAAAAAVALLAGRPPTLALVWAAHIGADRALGYGLKYGSGFGDT